MLDFLKWRLGPNYNQLVDIKLISRKIIVNDITKIRNILQSQNYQIIFYKSFENERSGKVRKILSQFPLLPESQVKVYWDATRDGILITYKLFIKYYDDLWYPSSDDVWIFDDGLEWLLEISHEEEIAFYKLK